MRLFDGKFGHSQSARGGSGHSSGPPRPGAALLDTRTEIDVERISAKLTRGLQADLLSRFAIYDPNVREGVLSAIPTRLHDVMTIR